MSDEQKPTGPQVISTRFESHSPDGSNWVTVWDKDHPKGITTMRDANGGKKYFEWPVDELGRPIPLVQRVEYHKGPNYKEPPHITVTRFHIDKVAEKKSIYGDKLIGLFNADGVLIGTEYHYDD